MPSTARALRPYGLCLALAALLSFAWCLGCGGSGATFGYFGSPFRTISGGDGGPPASGGDGAGGDGGSAFDSGGRVNIDPCDENQSRKFIRISLGNAAQGDYVHYFLVLVAYVNSETVPDGAVCSDDIGLYTSFGYILIPEGTRRAFGHYCFEGPVLLYFHRNGQFRAAGGATGTQLASAIRPAQGTVASFDAFFTSAGAQVPVPNDIVFFNPGTGDGARLKVSRNDVAPCDPLTVSAGDPACAQDAFYYVDERDLMTGSTALGPGSGRRVPNEIQETGCTLGFSDPRQVLAPSSVTANNAQPNEFLRGGSVTYIFVRNDSEPPFPQLIWRVTDQSGAVVHDFDPRADYP